MQDPSYRNVALLPVLAVLAGGVIALGTLVGQGAPESGDCGPGTHSMAEMGSMPGMDHGRHMAMGGASGCMDGKSMEEAPAKTPAKHPPKKPAAKHPTMDHSTMPGMTH